MDSSLTTPSLSPTSPPDSCVDITQLVRRYFLPVSYAIIFIVGLVGNITSISIYMTKLRPWKSSSIIMVNLALTDLLYVLSLPFLVHYYSNEESWTLGDFMCSYVRFGFHFNLYGSILFLTCLAVFRYVVVLRPLMAAQVEQKLWGVCACMVVWIIAAAGTIPILQIITLDNGQTKTCRDFASTEPVQQVYLYSWVLTAIGFLLPLVVVVMCYIGIVKQLTQGPYTTSPCRMRARRVTVLVLVVFVVCFLPYHILRVLRIETRRIKNPECMMYNIVNVLYVISRPLAGLNTVFNLALYTLSGDRFRKAFLSTFNFERWLTKARSLLHLTIHSKAANDRPPEGVTRL